MWHDDRKDVEESGLGLFQGIFLEKLTKRLFRPRFEPDTSRIGRSAKH
jgi:hypothetical protein